MSLELRQLTLEQLRTLHATELHEAFPPEELKPIGAMEELLRRGAYHPVGAWEGEDLVGYALLWTGPASGYVLVDYLGVTASRRSQGLGSQILHLLGETFQDRDGILVESEAPQGGEQDALQRRRLAFYTRCGFVPLSYDCLLFGVHYRTFLLSPNGKGTEAAALAAHQALYAAQFPPEVLARYIQIPRDPAAPLAAPGSWAGKIHLPGWEEKGVSV